MPIGAIHPTTTIVRTTPAPVAMSPGRGEEEWPRVRAYQIAGNIASGAPKRAPCDMAQSTMDVVIGTVPREENLTRHWRAIAAETPIRNAMKARPAKAVDSDFTPK